VIHGARNDAAFAPFVRSLFPIDSSKMLEAQNLPADRSREILVSAGSQGDLARGFRVRVASWLDFDQKHF
jgi:hypothetical protein